MNLVPSSKNPESAPAEQNGARRVLLVVDDDSSVRQSLSLIFDADYNVLLAESGQQAIDIALSQNIDAAVVDLRMPNMDGIEVLRQLKQIDSSIEVVILTGHETVESAREAIRYGACDYLGKPSSVDTLRSSVATAMHRHEISRKIASYDQRLAQMQEEMQHQQFREELARTRNEIYASIIHDINGPLTIIAGYLDILQQDIGEAHYLDEEKLDTARIHLRSVSRQVSNCIELSRRYLGFLQGRAPSRAPLPVRDVLIDLKELLKPHPSVKNNTLLIQTFNSPVRADINGTDLLQALLNITINALQCTSQPHKVEVYARLVDENSAKQAFEKRRFTHLMRSEKFSIQKPFLAISIQDDGPGIPEELLTRIFEPYFTTKPDGKGSGLGLAIVQRLVTQAKGALHVYSHPGEGAVFTIFLQVHDN